MLTYQLFPLTVAHDVIRISDDERTALSEQIKSARDVSRSKSNNTSWTGDVWGHEFIFNDPLYEPICERISKKILSYLDVLSVDTNMLELYHQRSWATVTEEQQHIELHTHAQSNISFVYYLEKPPNTGGIIFRNNDLQNEIANDIFKPDCQKNQLVISKNEHNSNSVTIDCEQDSILIFPSKTLHATESNESGKTRISLSGDITLMLKDSSGFEHLMPSYRHWKPFEKRDV